MLKRTKNFFKNCFIPAIIIDVFMIIMCESYKINSLTMTEIYQIDFCALITPIILVYVIKKVRKTFINTITLDNHQE